jgi:hypothetical protein
MSARTTALFSSLPIVTSLSCSFIVLPFHRKYIWGTPFLGKGRVVGGGGDVADLAKKKKEEGTLGLAEKEKTSHAVSSKF